MLLLLPFFFFVFHDRIVCECVLFVYSATWFFSVAVASSDTALLLCVAPYIRFHFFRFRWNYSIYSEPRTRVHQTEMAQYIKSKQPSNRTIRSARYYKKKTQINEEHMRNADVCAWDDASSDAISLAGNKYFIMIIFAYTCTDHFSRSASFDFFLCIKSKEKDQRKPKEKQRSRIHELKYLLT